MYLSLPKNSHVELSYGIKYDDSDIVRETLGFDFTSTPFKNFNIYGNTKYDVISESTSELLVGIKVSPINNLSIKGEYYESFPTFDTNSIYSVFAVDKYKEKSLKAEYQLNNNYSFNIGYSKEDFNNDKNANLYEVGVFASPIKNLTMNANYEKRTGYAEQLSGIRLSADYKFSKTLFSAGIDYDDFKRDASRSSVAKKYWIGAKHDIYKNTTAVLKLEDNENFNYNHSYQGIIALNVNF